MPVISAGLLLCRFVGPQLQFLLAHPGGPFFARKDLGAWTIPKGRVEPGENPRETALREFGEETGYDAPNPEKLVALGTIRQRSGKIVHGWAFVGDADPAALKSNPFEMEWPPRSGRYGSYPEIDRVEFYDLDLAAKKILEAQQPFLQRARERLTPRSGN